MATKEEKPGYVYILTNPSFREDWVKIGMTQNMEERLRTLDTTALPLPFKKYATMKTVKYKIAEKHVHHYIERFTNLRIRANREFFNVTPEEALSIFYEVAELLDDAEIEVFAPTAEKPKKKRRKIISEQTETIINFSEPKPSYAEITPDTLKGRATISLNGEEPIGKGRLGFAIVRTYLQEHPNSTMNELKKIFHIGLLGTWGRWNMLEDDIAHAEELKKTSGHHRHHTNPKFILTSGDGIKFVVCNQWDNINTLNLIRFAKEQGWEVIVKPENTKE